MLISKSGPVLGLIEVQGGEELFTQVRARKKAIIFVAFAVNTPLVHTAAEQQQTAISS